MNARFQAAISAASGRFSPVAQTWSIFRRKCRTAFSLSPDASLYVLHALWAIPGVLMMRALRPWLHVRIYRVHGERIGHFVGDTALFLAQRTVKPPRRRTADLYWFPDRSSNDQWARMVRRKLTVRWWVRYLLFYNRALPGSEFHIVPLVPGTRDTEGLLPRCTVRFEFIREEHDQARAWLRRRGWRDDEPFVCLLVRDSAYLSAYFPPSVPGRWNYHSYRDSDIASYAQAVERLLERGYWVVRMGKSVRRRLTVSHPRVIDYPFVEDRNDLMDVWLAAHCSLFVSTGTGIDMVPVVYGRPVVFVNFNPFNNLFSFADSISVPKHLYWRTSGQALTLRQHCEHGYIRTEDYEAAGIGIRDLSPAEIAAAVEEGVRRVDGTWSDPDDNLRRQQRFWDVLRESMDFTDLHGRIHPRARIGSAWLQSAGEAFLE